MTVVRINVEHTPVVHVACFKTVKTCETQFTIAWSEIRIRSCVDSSDLIVEQGVC